MAFVSPTDLFHLAQCPQGPPVLLSIREYIDEGIAPPNSPVTLSGGWIYNRVAKKGVLVRGKAGDKPMFDTGALYNDFDYEVTSR